MRTAACACLALVAGSLSAPAIPGEGEAPRREIGGKDDDLTGLLPRSMKGPVPPGARTVEVTLESRAGTGSTDGYADDLSLVVRRAR